jgi:hypothetical protein
MQLILYSKPDCHLCEGLLEKLNQIQTLNLEIEIRDITTNDDWYNLYQYEVPVLYQKLSAQEILIPRPSPRISVTQLERMLQKYNPESL